MSKDFRASQIRTAQIIASGSTLNKPSLIVASASSPGVDFDGSGMTNAVLMANVGQDVFVFVSGTSGSQGTQTPGITMFGGDIFVSGNIVTPDGVITASANVQPGGSTTQVQFNDGGTFGGDTGMSYAKGGWDLTVGGSVLTPTVSPATGTLTLDSDSSMIIGGATIAITADGGDSAGSVVVTTNDTTVGIVVGNVANVPVTLGHATSETTIGDNLTVTGDLTVNGTTTTVNSDNLVVKDPLVYIASGNTSSNQNGGLAIASGSNTTDQALVFGRVGNDTWGAGKLDVEAGGIAGGDVSAMTVVPIRASRFEVGGTGGGTYVTQSAAGHIEVVGSYIELGILNGASVIAVTASDVRFGNLSLEYNWEIPPMPGADSFYFVSGSIGAKDGGTATTSVFGGDLVVSGNMHALNGITGSITKLTNGSSYMVAGTNMTLTTGTNGDVTFDAAGGGGSSYWFEDTAGFVATYTTGTVAISGGSGVEAAQLGAGLDTNFWVSGSTEDQIDGDTPHITTFGGHVVVSGAIYGGENPFGPGTRLLNLRSDVIAMHSSQLGEYGDDVAIVLQGTQGSKNSSTRGVTEFTGDVHISGSRTGGSAYGGMYAYTTGSEQTLVANTPEIVDWGALNASEMSGSAFGASPDIVSNNIAITQPGPWNVSFNASFSGTAESVVNLECRFGAEIQNHIAAQTVLNQVGSAMSVSAAGIIDVPEGGGFLELWVESNNTAITFKRLSMFATSL